MALCLLSACSTHITKERAKSPVISKQEYLQRANLLLSKADKQDNPSTATNYRLQAIESFILAEELTPAEQLLANIKPTGIEQESFTQILHAQLANAKQQYQSAMIWLQKIWSPYTLHYDLQIKFLQARAYANLRLGSNLEAVNDYIRLHNLLTDPTARKNNAQDIWNILGQLTPAALHEIDQQQNNSALSGWVSFVHITKQYDTSTDQMARALAVWQQRYPNHAANLLNLNQPEASTDDTTTAELTTPHKIGLLLPLSGAYANSAEVIKDGFLSAYYQHSQLGGIKTEVKIYDTTKQYTPGKAGDVMQAYHAALADHVDFLVGPLVKEDVEKLTHRGNSNVPVLALNTVSTGSSFSRSRGNFFQFGLSPEIEARAVAAQAQQDGFRRAILFVTDNEQGQRVTSAFRSSWEQSGLNLVSVMKVSEKSNLNENIRKLLGVTVVETHRKDPKTTAMRNSSAPKRRQDIDVIILATTPNLARQIKPMLNFYYANDLPVYATSSIYTGKLNPSLDQDLNGIKFCDMPWVLDQTIASRRIYQTIAKLWPNNLAQTPRLFALGIDAYKLANQMQQLSSMPDLGISGMTGMLMLDDKNRVTRNLMWATFKNGVPVLNTNG